MFVTPEVQQIHEVNGDMEHCGSVEAPICPRCSGS